MRTFRGFVPVVRAEMEFLPTGAKPDTGAFGEPLGLGDLVEAEQLPVEAARVFLAAARNRDERVVEPDD